MKRRFNVTGACIPEQHYMVDTSGKMARIMDMIENGDYFVINRPRQYGKTTTLLMLDRALKKNLDYLPLRLSFEGMGQKSFGDEIVFSDSFILMLKEVITRYNNPDWLSFFNSHTMPERMDQLGFWIGELVRVCGKKVVLMIDEVDKSTNNQLFLDFLGMLRNKYLKRSEEGEYTFHSVILAGVHDVKSLKAKIRPDSEAKFNSPWNIAVDFDLDMTFSAAEIETMLAEYVREQAVMMDIPVIAERLFYFTSGYPFLVSYLCKLVHEELLPSRVPRQWLGEDLDLAFQMALKRNNTNFESLIQNLENNQELYDYIFKIVMDGTVFSYNTDNPLIQFGVMFGMLRDNQGRVSIHNQVYEQRIYKYMESKLESGELVRISHVTAQYLDEGGFLDIPKVFLKFQSFMKEQYSQRDFDFLERNGRLLFLAFLRPIINGRGYDFKEVQISEERRLDVVVTFDSRKYILELKIWRGPAYHEEGLQQLGRYLESQQVETGYLLIFDLRKESGLAGQMETVKTAGKTLCVAWV